jgi:hypothetical protein
MYDTASESLERPEFSPTEIAQGRIHAILSYIVPFFLFVPLRRRANAFAFFHARQALTLWAGAVAAAFVFSLGVILITLILLNVPVSVTLGLLTFAIFIVAVCLSFVGVRNAWNGRGDVLPGVGRYGETHVSLLVKG